MPGMTLTEKIVHHHVLGRTGERVRAGDLALVRVDWMLASELAWNGMNEAYDSLNRPPLLQKERVYLAVDHTVDSRTLAASPKTQRLVQLSRDFAREAGLTRFYDANETIMHTEFYRQLVRPGDLVVGADSHTCSHGGMGALAIGLGGADVVAAMVLGYTWIQVPDTIRVHYPGRLPFGVTGKDVVLKTLGELGRNTVALERAVEYTADCLEAFSPDFRFTVCNMTAEFGGITGIFPPDGLVSSSLAGRRDAEFQTGGVWLTPDDDAVYADRFVIGLETLAPQVAKPFSPDNVQPAAEVEGQAVDGCFIGACTTSQDELILAALVLDAELSLGRRPTPCDKRLVIPGSREVARNLKDKGLLEIYRRAGFRIGEPGCSMCLGLAGDRAQPGEVWLTSQNRNFPHRMGKDSVAWLASAATVAASAFQLKVTDPSRVLARIDQDRWARLTGNGISPRSVKHVEPEPPVTGRPRASLGSPARAPAQAARSGRVQCFGDHVDTDAIIPGEFCHLSDVQALGERAFCHVRPDFVDRVKSGQTVLVAGEGWGCGSSREHAAWALKGAGVQAIIAKSVAFIHKRNLINTGVPFVILKDDAFFTRVRDGDVVVVDSTRGRVQLDGRVYRGDPVPEFLANMIGVGGIVPFVRQRLAEETARVETEADR